MHMQYAKTQFFPEKYANAFEKARQQGTTLIEAEREVFGAGHPEQDARALLAAARQAAGE